MMANRPSGANSIACGLISIAAANAISEGMYLSSDASMAQMQISSVNTESICPHAAESISAAGFNRYSAAIIAAAFSDTFLRRAYL